MIKHLPYLGVAAALAAWAFDFFFWGKAPGIFFKQFLNCFSEIRDRKRLLHPVHTAFF